MPSIFAASARLEQGWQKDVRLEIKHGRIVALELNATPRPVDAVVDTLLPALANLHSHSFQRAMAGMSEFAVGGHDNFWSWRELMYRFAARVTPEQIEAIAALAFMEMQEAGFASVGEFHYLHHQKGGQPYSSPAELSSRIFAAAITCGIGLTHLPVLYSYGGAGKKELSARQLRFGNDVERFNALVSLVQAAAKVLSDDIRVGVAAHSLRATSPDDLAQLVAAHPKGPVHIHMAEQLKEVSDIKAWLGAAPVEWLLDNAPIDQRWCLIHATHMSENETRALARSGAVAGLCPITEANLGDGIFNGSTYVRQQGAFGIGSDSNVRISMREELAMLEYCQRLHERQRNIWANGKGSVGEALYLGAARGAAQALGRDGGQIRVGALADLVAIDRTTPALLALGDNQLLDGLVFAAGDDVISDLWSAGRHMVQSGRHIARDRIIANYSCAISALLADI